MGRTLNKIIAVLPKKRRQRIDARYHELKDEIEAMAESAPMTTYVGAKKKPAKKPAKKAAPKAKKKAKVRAGY